MKTMRCIHCKKEWGVSAKSRYETDSYICPVCEGRIRRAIRKIKKDRVSRQTNAG